MVDDEARYRNRARETFGYQEGRCMLDVGEHVASLAWGQVDFTFQVVK